MAKEQEGVPTPAQQERRLGEVLTFMRALWAVDHGLRSTSKQMQRAIGLSGPQRLAIRMIGRFPSATAGELASLLHIHPSTLTGVLARLERRSLIRRREDRTDGRRARFELTPQGRAIDVKRSGTVEARVTRALSGLSDSQIASARLVLDLLAQELTTTKAGRAALTTATAADRLGRRRSVRDR